MTMFNPTIGRLDMLEAAHCKRKLRTTHVKISQLVASLQASREQVMFARLVKSCQQVWNKLFNNLQQPS